MIKQFLGIDIGGSKIYAARYGERGRLLQSLSLPTPDKLHGKLLLMTLDHCIQTLWSDHVVGIGIAAAGFVDTSKGILVSSPNLPKLAHLPISQHCRQKWHVPAVLLNDAKAFTYGEAVLGGGMGAACTVGLTFGTGVGCGVVVHGEIFGGGAGFAGEIGHISQGKTELEHMLGGKFTASYLNSLLGTEFTNSKEIEEHILQKGPDHLAIRKALINPLHTLCETVTLAYNPQVICLGGSVGTTLIDILLPDLRSVFTKHLQRIGFPTNPKIHLSALPNGGSLGAAMYIQRHRTQK